MEYRELSEYWESFPATANIYLTVASPEATADIYALATRLGVSDIGREEWVETGAISRMNRGSDAFTLYRPSGAVQYFDSTRWQTDDGVSTMDVSDKVAATAGYMEVDRLDLRGHDEFRLEQVNRLYAASGTAGTPLRSPRIIDAGVVFRRFIDDLPVAGKGGRIIVYLDRELRLTGCERTARRIASVQSRTQGWRSVEEVLEDIRAHWNQQNSNTATVTGLQLSYFEGGRMAEQHFIQPTFCLDLDLQPASGGMLTRVRHYMPAATNGIDL
ncbi:hypothetical protein [Kitasatospora sp. NPDC094011]|uniref:hypothetical protein n=1 Tax=Kitasatospora sp. NPDC094011 TaxID=3364090 RepID=UPI003819AFB3